MSPLLTDSTLHEPGIKVQFSTSSVSIIALEKYIESDLACSQLCKAQAAFTIFMAVGTDVAIGFSNIRNRDTNSPKAFSTVLLALDNL